MAAQNKVPYFLPSRNGWPFANDLRGTFPVVTLPVIGTIASANAGNGICGGFVFTVRDLFEHRPLLAPDANAAAPVQGSPTFSFLSSRFLDSFGPTGYANAVKAITWTQTPDHDILLARGLGHHMVTTEWPAVRGGLHVGDPGRLARPCRCACRAGDGQVQGGQATAGRHDQMVHRS